MASSWTSFCEQNLFRIVCLHFTAIPYMFEQWRKNEVSGMKLFSMFTPNTHTKKKKAHKQIV